MRNYLIKKRGIKGRKNILEVAKGLTGVTEGGFSGRFQRRSVVDQIVNTPKSTVDLGVFLTVLRKHHVERLTPEGMEMCRHRIDVFHQLIGMREGIGVDLL